MSVGDINELNNQNALSQSNNLNFGQGNQVVPQLPLPPAPFQANQVVPQNPPPILQQVHQQANHNIPIPSNLLPPAA